MGYSYDEATALVQSADELSVEDHLRFQALYQQEWANNAVSFTVNVRPGLAHEEVAETIKRWLPHLKGNTLMVDGSREQPPMERISKASYEAATSVLVADGVDEDCAIGACPVR
ncbi:hypothetical protein ACIBF5_29045 [Micromonospora sp. NPDC050417]|uniref:hypothetical protein n=1 Tax=Micromonospora sp. NPDC050417 TaxID=3364280 RepID=UPI00379DF75E